MLDEGGPNGLGDFPCPRFLAFAVAIDRRIATGFRELAGGLAQDDIDVRISRADKGGQQLRAAASLKGASYLLKTSYKETLQMSAIISAGIVGSFVILALGRLWHDARYADSSKSQSDY